VKEVGIKLIREVLTGECKRLRMDFDAYEFELPIDV
jgi:hypothetical protein